MKLLLLRNVRTRGAYEVFSVTKGALCNYSIVKGQRVFSQYMKIKLVDDSSLEAQVSNRLLYKLSTTFETSYGCGPMFLKFHYVSSLY